MTAVNVKICKIILRAHYSVKVEINEQPSLVIGKAVEKYMHTDIT